MEHRPAILLRDFVFSAKIDYLSISTPGRQSVPETEGRVIWPASLNGLQLTIHDPTPEDVTRLANAIPLNAITEVEVAIDVRPKGPHEDDERALLLASLKVMVARRLNPRLPAQQTPFRGAYSPKRKGPAPFNRRVPGPSEQLLYGHRHSPAQVKVYIKRADNGKALPCALHSVRLEVRLADSALAAHHLNSASDLIGFSYRKELSRYFRHVSGSVRRPAKDARPQSPLLLSTLHRAQDRFDLAHWDVLGVGAFLPGGLRSQGDKRFLRDKPLNDRIGQSLHRLQTSYAAPEFVCSGAASIRKV